MRNTKEIKFLIHGEALIGRQNGTTFTIREMPGVIAGTPAYWVTVVPGGDAPYISTLDHQYFHLKEAKMFCQRIAAGKIDLEILRAQYEAEDLAKIRDFRAKGLSYLDYLELEQLKDSLGEDGHQVLLKLAQEDADSSMNPSRDVRSVL